MKIILGSKSVRRKWVLKNAGYDFEVMTADIDEKKIRISDPRQLVLALAHAKAEAILPKINTPGVLITADQVVVCNGKILEQPRDEKEAREFISYYLEYPMETVSSIVVTDVMTKTVVAVASDVNVETAAKIMAKAKIKKLPVVSKGKLVGIITATDIISSGISLEEATLTKLSELFPVAKPKATAG